jgi:hypothetical protein
MTALEIAIGALVLAAVHVFAGRLRFLDRVPRSRWLSLASGTSVAYVFVHLLPQLTVAQASLEREAGGALDELQHHAYLAAAFGLAAFYGLERLARRARRERSGDPALRATPPAVFWLHIGSFGIYNVLIGYLLAGRESATHQYAAFVLALALHFLVNDYGLRDHHRERYHTPGRWILALAVLAGAVLGVSVPLSEPVVLGILAFIAGGIVLNVLKEELPVERESRFGAFALGMVGFAALLMLS